jgi:hypothetical protein
VVCESSFSFTGRMFFSHTRSKWDDFYIILIVFCAFRCGVWELVFLHRQRVIFTHPVKMRRFLYHFDSFLCFSQWCVRARFPSQAEGFFHTPAQNETIFKSFWLFFVLFAMVCESSFSTGRWFFSHTRSKWIDFYIILIVFCDFRSGVWELVFLHRQTFFFTHPFKMRRFSYH